ncbi:DNA-3-methyladenine glycosylase family protein [Pseudoneobacillus sp. C159]
MMNPFILTLEDDRVQTLCKQDELLGKLIHMVGSITDITLNTDYYRSMVRGIIGQQLSVKAAGTIANRVMAVWEDFEPEKLKNVTDEDLRNAGVSWAKIKYIRHLTENVLTGELDFNTLPKLSDEEVIQKLTKIKGIGKWTAEMFLIFSLGRLNILSHGDVSIQNSIRWLFQIPKEEPLDLDSLYQKWNPYNSVASLYLWEALDRGIISQHPNGIIEVHETQS